MSEIQHNSMGQPVLVAVEALRYWADHHHRARRFDTADAFRAAAIRIAELEAEVALRDRALALACADKINDARSFTGCEPVAGAEESWATFYIEQARAELAREQEAADEG